MDRYKSLVYKKLEKYKYILIYILLIYVAIILIIIQNNYTYIVGTALLGSSTIGFLVEIFGLKRLFDFFGISYKFLYLANYIEKLGFETVKIISNRFLENLDIIDSLNIKLFYPGITYVGYRINNNFNFYNILLKIIEKIKNMNNNEVKQLVKAITNLINYNYNYIIVIINKRNIRDENIEKIRLRHSLITTIIDCIGMNNGIIFYSDNIDKFISNIKIFIGNNIEVFEKINNINEINNFIENNFIETNYRYLLKLNYISIIAINIPKSNKEIILRINYKKFRINTGSTLIKKVYAYSDEESRLTILSDPVERPSPWDYKLLLPYTLIEIKGERSR